MSEQSTTPERPTGPAHPAAGGSPAAEPAQAPEQAPEQAAGHSRGGTRSAREVNDQLRYAMWSVFAVTGSLPDDRAELAAEAEAGYARLAGKDLVVRGWYDVSGMRADADLVIWTHGPSIDVLQDGYRQLRRTRLGQQLKPVWSVAALHRPAEFNRGHVPAFLAGEPARGYLCLYPFVRSYEWYLLPEEERRALLVEHGMAGRGYPDVRANTMATFGLSDYEWILAFEADELPRIVDLMRDLRAVGARRHVRHEIPFFTGPRVAPAELVATLP
jgi:chlorite dismutase